MTTGTRRVVEALVLCNLRPLAIVASMDMNADSIDKLDKLVNAMFCEEPYRWCAAHITIAQRNECCERLQ
jgi:hypothetical protein